MTPSASLLYRIAGEAVSLFFRGSQHSEAHLLPHAWQMIGGELADFNLALVDAAPDAEAQLRSFHARLHDRQRPGVILLTPAVATQLAGVAQELGLLNVGHMPLMIRSFGELPAAPHAYTCTRVAHPNDLQTAYQIMARGFELPLEPFDQSIGTMLIDGPGVSVFLARQGQVPQSTVTGIQAGSIIGIWSMATAPDYQRQGAGRAILEHALAYYQERGAEWFYLLATEAGQPLYQRLGFYKIADLAVWAYGH